jgi:hypothetical protein
LAAVGVAEDGHFQQGEGGLRGIFDVGGKEYGSGTGAENGAAFGGELSDGVEKPFFLEELKLRGAFAAGEDEGVGFAEIGDGTDFDGLRTELLENGGVCGEVALDGEDADFHESYQFSVISFERAYHLQKAQRVGHPIQPQEKSRFLAALGMTNCLSLAEMRRPPSAGAAPLQRQT